MEATSVAIWKRNIVAVATASTIWTVNGAFFIQGESPIFIPSRTFSQPVGYRYLAGE